MAVHDTPSLLKTSQTWMPGWSKEVRQSFNYQRPSLHMPTFQEGQLHDVKPRVPSKPQNSQQGMMLGMHRMGRGQAGDPAHSNIPFTPLKTLLFAAGGACVFPAMPFPCILKSTVHQHDGKQGIELFL